MLKTKQMSLFSQKTNSQGNLFVALAIDGGTPKKIITGNVIAEPLLASVFISPLRSPQNKKRIIAEISIFVIFYMLLMY